MSVRRIMIITWKWEDLDPESNPVDLYFPVKESQEDRVIRINEFRSEAAIERLEHIISDLPVDAQIQVFLHQDHRYNQEDIRQLYQSLPDGVRQQCKCFLFGGGKDYLYFSSSEVGLLDDFGWFMNEPEYEFKLRNGEEKPRIGMAAIVDYNKVEERWEILPRFFDKVWAYYQDELKRKIFELKEDILNDVYPHFLVNGQPFQWNDLVLSRIRNFCGEADSGLLLWLEKQEDQQERPYIFKTLENSLQQQYGAEAAVRFQQLKELLSKSVLSENEDNRALRTKIPEIRKAFDHLLMEI